MIYSLEKLIEPQIQQDPLLGTRTMIEMNICTDPPLNTVLLSNTKFALCSGTYLNQGWYDDVIAVDPVDRDIVWAGGVDLLRSDDGGQNWGWATQGSHVDQHVFAFHPDYDGSNNKILFVGNDGGVYRTDDARAGTDLNVWPGPTSQLTWTSVNNNYGVTQFYHGAPLPGWAGLFRGHAK